jgi:ATP-binding cassette, subfamily F, member 3
MIQFENITKSFGAHTLFENVTFQVNPRERIGLVGRNGHGKTTLFRLIVNEEHVDGGMVVIPKLYRIGYVKQQVDFTKKTVLEECMTGLLAHDADHHWKAEKILFGLGFSEKDLLARPEQFSGGYQVRLNLAKMLVSEPDLLLLDEPTNYLDITSIRWVERFLVNWPREVMIITHDRGFMDKVATHILGIHRKKIKKIAGDTGKYYAQVAQEEEIYEKTRVNDDKRRKEIELFISRFRAKARLANMVQSRIKTLAKKDKQAKLEKLKDLEFSFKDNPFHGKYVCTVKELSFFYEPEKPLISKFNLAIGTRDRICIIGKNGKGKTTLLKLLAGALAPQQGEISYHPAVTKGFFEQNQVQGLVDTRNVLEEILYSNPDVDPQTARNIAGAMMFTGDDAIKKIQVLSGGEKSRVILGKLLVTPVSLLLLDEPTNHLDMESTDAMLAAIDNFDGTVILVTHNEMFLHAIARRLIVFQNGQIEIFEGVYQDFLDRVGWQEDESPAIRNANYPQNSKPAKKEIKRLRSDFMNERAKVLTPLKENIRLTETHIEEQEKKLQAFNLAMQKASEGKESARIQELSKSIYKCQADIDRSFDELERFTHAFEENSANFDQQLQNLEDQWK